MKILIIGGNRFFGRHLAESLLQDGHEITLLNRGKFDDRFGDQIKRIKADRKNKDAFVNAVSGERWDIIVDQICYTAEEARVACDIFQDKTKRYIVTSSASVYDDGQKHPESHFDPTRYTFATDASATENYKEAKRQVEVIFSRSTFPELVIVRPSYVVGVDDYTDRLGWHLKKIMNGLPIYFPNLDVEADFILSDQIGQAMKTIALSNFVGAINCTSPDVFSLRELMQHCEACLGKKIIFAKEATKDNHSPYGGTSTLTMDTTLLASLGVKVQPSKSWMDELIKSTRC